MMNDPISVPVSQKLYPEKNLGTHLEAVSIARYPSLPAHRGWDGDDEAFYIVEVLKMQRHKPHLFTLIDLTTYESSLIVSRQDVWEATAGYARQTCSLQLHRYRRLQPQREIHQQ